MPRLIDLTLPLRAGDRGISWDTANTVEKDGWNARLLHLYSHAGTHMDAPVHFGVGDQTIERIPLTHCMGRAHVANLSGVSPREELLPGQLGKLEHEMQPGESLLLRTDWWRHLESPAVYRDGLPRISDALAHWCVQKQVRILGVEAPSVADVNDLAEVSRIHRILFEGGVIIVEGLRRLDQITHSPVFFIALPLPIATGDGCPCRAMAIEGEDAVTVIGDVLARATLEAET